MREQNENLEQKVLGSNPRATRPAECYNPFMKIGLLSDSHGNIKVLRRAVQKLLDEKVDLIIHLGDDSTDVDPVRDLIPADKLIVIPGVYEPCYFQPGNPNRLVKTLGGIRFLITHTPTHHQNDRPDDIRPEDMVRRHEVDVVLHGHTHIPRDASVHSMFLNGAVCMPRHALVFSNIF